jgi:hypothetical protein
MKKTITKTFTETHEVEVTLPMYVKDNSGWHYALLEEEKYIEVALDLWINGIKTLELPIDRYIQLPQITEEEFLKAYAEANSINVVNYHKHFTKSNVFIEMVSGGNEE